MFHISKTKNISILLVHIFFMKRLIIWCIWILCSNILCAQDTLFTTNGDVVHCSKLTKEKVYISGKKTKGYSYKDSNYEYQPISEKEVKKVRYLKFPLNNEEVVFSSFKKLYDRPRELITEKLLKWLGNDWKYRSKTKTAWIGGFEQQYNRRREEVKMSTDSSEIQLLVFDDIELPLELPGVFSPIEKSGFKHTLEYKLTIKARNNFVRITISNITIRMKSEAIGEYEFAAESYNKIICLCELSNEERQEHFKGLNSIEIANRRKEYSQYCKEKPFLRKLIGVRKTNHYFTFMIFEFMDYIENSKN